MQIDEVYEATTGNCTDIYYVETGMYNVHEYGSVYILDTERPAVVDTGIGTNYERVLDAMAEVGIEPEDLAVIALTHVHLDHAGGAGYLVDACPNATVYVHEYGARALVDPGRLWEGTRGAVGTQFAFYAEPKPIPEARIVELTDGDTIDLGDQTLEALHAPGHAPHQVVFYDAAVDAVFTADAAGIYSPSADRVHVTSPPVDFDLEQALEDVAMIQSLDPETLLYAHFGPAPTGDRLETYADTLTDWVGAIEARRAEVGDDEAVVEHFTQTAEMPEIWGERKAMAEIAMNVRGVLIALDREE